MIDILKKYYDLELEYSRKYNDGLVFFVNGDYYYLYKTILSSVDIQKAYELSILLKDKKILLHDFVFNKDGELLSEQYVLLKLNYMIDDIDLNDIKQLQINIEYDYREDFYKLWTNKIDYLEKQLVDLSNDHIINYSFDYFEGIAEMLLSYYKDNVVLTNNDFIVHRVFYTLNTIDFYNPLNIILGDKYKDFASYIRITSDWDLLYELLNNIEYNNRLYLFIRLSFPFYYFNLVNSFVLGETTEEKIVKLVNEIDIYEKYLSKLEKVFGINLFSFIKKDN